MFMKKVENLLLALMNVLTKIGVDLLNVRNPEINEPILQIQDSFNQVLILLA